ncbi:MAG TPA: hypothetical protein VKZ98_05830 [Aquaticitalea sp.]|nr:hypothetical protein [Aquaticitalea sp.]
MKRFIPFLCCCITFFVSISCSKDYDDNIQNSNILGVWELAGWSLDIEMDLNNDSVFSTNLLDEAPCQNYETLIFEADGTFSSNRTFNPTVNISLVNGTTDSYVFDVACDTEGTIGLAGPFTQTGNMVTLLGNTAMINGNQLSIVYENAVEIYNEDFTEVVDTKNLTVIYGRK